MEFNDKEKASLVKQEILQALHDENKRLGLYDDVYAVETLEQENRLLRARNDRLEKELAMYQVQRLGQEIQPERDYERGFIDGMQKQMQSSVDKAVNRLAQPEQEYGVVAGVGKGVEIPAGVKYYYIEPKLPPQRKPLTDEMRKQMKERCDSMEMRGAFADGWMSSEAAHNIKE